MARKAPRKIKFVHLEGGEPITREAMDECHEFFADLVFNLWRKDFEARQKTTADAK